MRLPAAPVFSSAFAASSLPSADPARTFSDAATRAPHRLAARPAAITALLAACLLLGACDSPPSVVKIGVAQPLSGSRAARGQDLLNGVTLAVDELNRDGFRIHGKPVRLEVVAMDDRADPATGVDIARRMVEAGVSAVIGNLNSGVSIAAAPVYAAAHIPQLAISTNPQFTAMGLPTTFRLVANDKLQARAMGAFAATQLNASAFAVLDDGTTYGKDLADGAAAELVKSGRRIDIRHSFDDRTTDFAGLAERLKLARVDAIVSTLNDFQVMALMEALQRAGHTGVSILGGDTLKSGVMLKGSDKIKALYATSPILDPKEFLAGKAFLDRYQAAFKMAPAYGGHYTYDATYVLASAMRRAESAQGDKITAQLHTIDGYAPVTGSMKWDAVGEQRYGVVGIYAARQGLWDLQMRSDRW